MIRDFCPAGRRVSLKRTCQLPLTALDSLIFLKWAGNSVKSKRLKTRRPKAPDAARIPARKASPSANRRFGKLFEDLVELQIRLLAPNGCPWDRQQTHESLRTYLIEEAYEVLDALESGDPDKFAEELGDLLLQIIFHSQLASQAGRFNVGDVIERVHTKMVRRHPHVFGTDKADSAAQVLKNWEQLKAEERRQERAARGLDAADESDDKSASLLSGIPRTLPAVMEAYQLTRRASRVGFDWPNIAGVLEKLREEIQELEAEIANGDAAKIESEAGDLLFSVVNVVRFLKLDPEIALKKANRKFIERFRDMETEAAAAGKKLADLNPAELDTLWNSAKLRQLNPPLTRKARR
jgi:tetrapyrrole methylase family protein/MazG family protein